MRKIYTTLAVLLFLCLAIAYSIAPTKVVHAEQDSIELQDLYKSDNMFLLSLKHYLVADDEYYKCTETLTAYNPITADGFMTYSNPDNEYYIPFNTAHESIPEIVSLYDDIQMLDDIIEYVKANTDANEYSTSDPDTGFECPRLFNDDIESLDFLIDIDEHIVRFTTNFFDSPTGVSAEVFEYQIQALPYVVPDFEDPYAAMTEVGL